MENTKDTTGLPDTGTSSKETGWKNDLLENILLESLREQRARRRWGIFFRFVWIAILLAILVLATTIDFSENENIAVGPHAALIKINGVIETGGAASAGNVNKALQKAFAEPDAAGIILCINSPGGSPVQAGRIHDEILRLKQRYPDKPVHVVVEDICASGGYYIAAAANNIYVDKASIVGSIGVMINGFGFTGLIDKVGIERRLLTAGKNKGFMDPFSPQSEQQRKFAQNLIDEVHEQFIAVVKTGRGARLKENDELFSGLIWTGNRAVELGLADGLGTVESVAREVIQVQSVVDYTEEEKLSDRVLKKLGASMGEGAVRYSFQEWLPVLR
ncbi:MAG: S49 family peptidase [Oxalobacter formigenes]|nr:S49 family peptidase [Oxalobacter formigenes]